MNRSSSKITGRTDNITENKKGRENTTLPFLMPKNILERTK